MRTALATLLVGLAIAVPVTPAHAACTVTVSLPNYSPDPVTVKPGTTVTWCWAQDNHSVTSAGFDSGVQNSGFTFTHTFGTAGTYTYHCMIHGSMSSKVVVKTSSPSPSHAPTPTKTTHPPTTPAATRTSSRPATTPPPTATRTTPPPTTAPATTTPPATTATTPAPSETPLAGVDVPVGHHRSGLPFVLALVAAGAMIAGVAWAVRTRAR